MIEYWTRLKAAMDAKAARDKAPFDVSELAVAMRVSYQAIAKVRNGGSFGKDNNIKAAKILGVNSEWLADGTGDMISHTAQGPQGAPGYSPVDGSDLVIYQYPNGGGMGHGVVLEDKQPGIIKSWNVSREWVRLNVPLYSSLQNLCIVTGFGPSMKPLYNPGDPLLMDRGVTTVDQEGVFFFRLGEMGYIKQLQRIPTENGLVYRAKSINPTYDTFDITPKMREDFDCFGKILTVWKSEQV